MAEGDTLEIQIEKLGKSLVASRGEFKETAKLLKAAQTHIAQLEALGPTPSGETVKKFVDGSITAGVAAASNELMQRCAALETQLAASTKTADEANAKFASAAVTNELREACRSQRIKPEAVGDVVAIGSGVLALVDGEVRTPEGLSAVDWLDTRKSVSGYWWPVARGAGSRGSGDGPGVTLDNPFSKDSWNMTKQSQLALQDPVRAARLQTEAAAMSRQ